MSGFIQGSYWNVATNFIEVELTGCHTSKVGKIFGFIESCKFTGIYNNYNSAREIKTC